MTTIETLLTEGHPETAEALRRLGLDRHPDTPVDYFEAKRHIETGDEWVRVTNGSRAVAFLLPAAGASSVTLADFASRAEIRSPFDAGDAPKWAEWLMLGSKHETESPELASVRHGDEQEAFTPSKETPESVTPVSVTQKGKPDKRGILHNVMTAWAEYEFGAPGRALPRDQTMTGRGDEDEGPLPLVEWEIVHGAIPRVSGVVRDILRQVYYHGCPLEGVHLPPGKTVGWLGWPWPELRDILLADALRRVSKALTAENVERIRKQYSQKVEAP